MAAAFAGLQDRLEHFTSALAMPGDVVDAAKLEDDAEPATPPNAVDDADGRPLAELVADESTALAAPEGLLVDDRMEVGVVAEPELCLCILEPPVAHGGVVVFNVVCEVSFVADEDVDDEGTGGPVGGGPVKVTGKVMLVGGPGGLPVVG